MFAHSLDSWNSFRICDASYARLQMQPYVRNRNLQLINSCLSVIEKGNKMKRRILAIICAAGMLASMTLSANAVSLETKCTRTWCSNKNVTVTLGSGSKSVSGETVTASTSNTSSRPVTAYAKAGITMKSGESYSRWDSGTTSASVSATLPSSAPSTFSSGWSDHSCESECWYCLASLSDSKSS